MHGPATTIALGATTSVKNASVTVQTTTTALLAAGSGSGARSTLLKNTGDRTVYVAFGVDAATTHYPLLVGETLRTEFTGAINGITASGTGTVFVLSEGR